MSAQADMSTLEYAQYHGLARDHLAEPLPFAEIKALAKEIPQLLTDDNHLPQIQVSPFFTTDERLTVDRGAALLLADANSGSASTRAVESIVLSLLDVRKRKKLKIETPLLRTDHESDIRKFAKWKEPTIKDVRQQLPMEPVDDERDEGLRWPSSWMDLPIELVKEIRKEKIEVSKQTLLYLQSAVRDDWTEEQNNDALKSATKYKKIRSFEPVTPPLLPNTLPSEPSSISSTVYNLPLLSDPDSLTSRDLRNVEKRLFEQDNIVDYEADSPDTLIGDGNIIRAGNTSSPATVEMELESRVFIRKKAEDLKVEVPLLHREPAFTLPKIVTFNDIVEEMRIDTPLSDAEYVHTRESSPIDAFFQEAFGDAAERAKRQVEQEQLLEVDTTLRVSVPLMDFSKPEPPWIMFRRPLSADDLQKVQHAMIRQVNNEYGHLAPWPGIKKLELLLRWTPFPLELGKVDLQEKLGTDEDFQPFLINTKDSDVIDSKGLTWKPPGLRILKDLDEEDEEELEPTSFIAEEAQDRHDLTSLVRKRKFELEKKVVPKQEPTPGQSFKMLNHVDKESISLRSGEIPNEFIKASLLPSSPRKESSSILLGSSFSTKLALDNFLELRGAKRQKFTESPNFQASPIAERKTDEVSQAASQLQNTDSLPRVRKEDLPSPVLHVPPTSTPFIMSSSIFQQRSLIKLITNLFPSANIIERDFSAHNTTAWLKPNSVTLSPVISPLAQEADIILSPSTGLILTSLTKIKQRPLPGQKSKTAIREKIEKASPRYEKMIVLVSEGNNNDTYESLDGSSSVALCEFMGFCNSIPTPTHVHYVPAGENSLGKWIVASMIRNCILGSGIQLLEEETHWELFLRRLGMNAFAAQAVIGELKAPEELEVSMSKMGLFGITGFVEMDREERLRRFEVLLGGKRILNMASDMLDASWF